MAFWGMDLEQSDEFCRAYDECLDLYDAGFDPYEATQRVLEKHMKLYGTPNDIPHNTVFAIAKAEWVLGISSSKTALLANEIIEAGKNIAYYRTLGFSEDQLMERREKLSAFQKQLQTPNNRVRCRKLSPCNQIKRLPKGTVSYYAFDGNYYGFIVLDAVYEGRLLAITEPLRTAPKSVEEILDSRASTAIWLLLRTAPKGNHDVGRIGIAGDYNGRGGLFLCKPVSFGIHWSFFLEECHQRAILSFENLRMSDLLDENNVPVEFYCEETADAEKRMVLELRRDPASKLATNMIQRAISLEGFFH